METRLEIRKMVMRMVTFVSIIHHRLEHFLTYINISDLHNYGKYASDYTLFFMFQMRC